MSKVLSKPTPWDINDIISVLPHRYPFILVDRVEKIIEGPNPVSRLGRKIIAIKNVTINEPFFPGHFPHRPIMPGVLIVEALAQAAALLSARVPPPRHHFDFLIAGIEKAKFRQPVLPGDTLELHAEVSRERSTIYGFKCDAIVRGNLVAEAEILALMIAVPD